MSPSEIFGRLDETLDNIEKHGRAKSKPRPRRPRTIPKINIEESAEVNSTIDFENVVHVPANLLKSIASAIDKNTHKLNSVLLRELMPLLLSYETSTNYTKAALKEGLKLDVDFDKGLASCVKSVGYLAIITHFIKSTRLPVSVKKRFVEHISDKLAEHAVQSLIEMNKTQERQIAMQELQAVVYERNKDKTTVHTKSEETPKSTPAVRRKRK